MVVHKHGIERQKAFFKSGGMELKQVKTLHMPALFHSSEMLQVYPYWISYYGIQLINIKNVYLK